MIARTRPARDAPSRRPATATTTRGRIEPPGAITGARAFGSWFPLVLLVALFAMVYAADLGHPRMLGWDESEYAAMGRDWLRGAGYVTYGRPEAMRLPMVPALVAATLAVAPHAGDAGLRVMAVLCMLAVLAVSHRFLARVADPVTALAATALLGAMPLIRMLAPLVLSEAPFMLCFTAAVWWLHEGLEGRPRGYLASAAAVGLASLGRYVGWLVVPIATLMLLVRLVTLGPRELARRTVATPAFWLAPLVASAVVAPWLARQWIVFGDPLEGVRESLSVVSVYGNLPWSHYLTRLPLMAGWPALAAAAIGVGVALRERGGAATTALIACVVVLAAHSRWPHKEDRYVSAMMPFLAALAGVGLERAARWMGARSGAPGAARVAAPALAVAGSLVTLFYAPTRPLDFSPAGDPTLMRAMTVVRETSDPGQVMVGASGPILHWYADRPVRQFPVNRVEMPTALEGASWVVFVDFERMQPAWAADLTRLLTAADEARGDVRVFRDGPYQVVIVRAPLLARRLAGAAPGAG